MKLESPPINVHDMIESPGFVEPRIYSVTAILLGALHQESVIELEALDRSDPCNAEGKKQHAMIPLEMLCAGWDWLARLVRFFRDPMGTEKMMDDFAKTFPGKCMICSYHRYGRREGMTTEPTPEHECIEVDSAPKDGTELLLLVRHANHAYASPEDRHQWEEWVKAKWIDHNGGGWTWHGIAGHAVAWKPLNKANVRDHRCPPGARRVQQEDEQ